jgi:hypothetical protein
MKKFTFLFQHAHKSSYREKEWIEDIFGPYIGDEVLDGEHKLVYDNVILVDLFIHANDPNYYKNFKGKNAFLLHYSDEFYEGCYDLYKNFKGVIRTHWASVFNPIYVKTLPAGYCTGLGGSLKIPRASLRPFVWSFSGQLNKSSRPDMAHALAKVEPHYLFGIDKLPGYVTRLGFFPERAGDGVIPILTHLSEPVLEMSRIQYQRVLLDSIFCPSPMGSAHIECTHAYDALECGSIPIVERRISLDYYRELLGPHPLPTVRSWTEARDLIRSLLQSSERLDTLQAECMAWWANKKATLRDEVGAFLEERSADTTPDDKPMFEPRANSNLWRYAELLRHHDLHTAARRVALMMSRIARGMSPRVAEPAYKHDSRR